MGASFDDAIPTILRHEGGFENDVNDPGGATNYGVSLRWLKSKNLLEELEIEEGDKDQTDVQAIKSMTRAQASGFFKAYWWDFYKYQNLLAQPLATKVFDMAINLGAPRAHRMLQTVIHVPLDGILGPKSFNEANALPTAATIVNLQTLQANFYRSLVATNPARAEFLQGWLSRAYDRD
jgi:lysozyme family protein